MRLENVLALTDAKLLNKPSISSFNSISLKLSNLKRGDLFIANNPQDIQEAIRLGAYGVIFDSQANISDVEIAWMHVSSVKDALSKILRFHLLNKNISIYECDEITLKLATQITSSKEVVVIGGDIYNAFEILWNNDHVSLLLFLDSFEYKNIFISIKVFPKITPCKINIIEQTLFETSFIYDNIFYERKLLSPFFIPYLENILQLFKNEKIQYNISSFNIKNHFQAVFINNNLEEKEFGSSEKVLIFEPSFQPILSQIEFLKRQAGWAKIIYIIPAYRQNKFTDLTNILTYNTKLDIINTIKTVDFHFALIAEQNALLLKENLIIKQPKQLTLDL